MYYVKELLTNPDTDYNSLCVMVVAVSTFMQPQWVVPSKKPKDLEIGWKEICENSVCFTSPSRKTQKRMSDFSGLVSMEMATEISHSLINSSTFNTSVCILHMLRIIKIFWSIFLVLVHIIPCFVKVLWILMHYYSIHLLC